MEPEEINTEHEVSAAEGGSPRRGVKFAALFLLLAIGVALAIIIYTGIRARAAAETALKTDTQEAAVATVTVVHPTPGSPTQELVLPGTTQAFIDSPIYARTNGYLKKWYFDIGAHVKKGQLLAEIETPEIDQQLQQAKADLETAQANLGIAKTTADRLQNLVKSGGVSQQETDQAVSDLSAKKATVDSNSANVRRLEQTLAFQKVYAPFDGIITARNTDIGALIDAGATSTARELFHMASISKLRVFVSVPEVYSRAAQAGQSATLTLEEFPGETFHGVIARSSNSIDTQSRTLLIEVDVDNPKQELLPGAYASVHLKLPQQIQAMTVPANSLIFRSEGLQLAIVKDGHAQLISARVGRDFGNTVEIIGGLEATDEVIADPSDSLVSGVPVKAIEQKNTGAKQQGASK